MAWSVGSRGVLDAHHEPVLGLREIELRDKNVRLIYWKIRHHMRIIILRMLTAFGEPKRGYVITEQYVIVFTF